MNYFISDWKQEDNDWEKDQSLNVVKLFLENELEHQLILINYMPFLRYKIQEHNIFSKSYWRIFDVMQNIRILDGHPLSIDDFDFSENVERIYSPLGIILRQDDETFGEVRFNHYGCIEKIIYFEAEEDYSNYYDDRGFLSTREITDKSGKLLRREYFNELGEKTITEHVDEIKRVIIEKNGSKHFKKAHYNSIDEMIVETLLFMLSKMDKKMDNLIAVTSATVEEITERLKNQIAIIRIITADQSLEQFGTKELENILRDSKAVVAETTRKYKELSDFFEATACQKNANIRKIPMFTTRLALGNSNSVVQLISYWRVGELTEETLLAHTLVLKNLIANQKYSFIFQVNSLAEQYTLQEAQTDFIDSHFGINSDSDDYQKAAHYIQAKRNRHLFESDELAVEELRNTDAWKNLVDAENAYSRIEFRVNPNLESIQHDFYEARLFIDLNKEYDLQIQALAVSAGIPLLLKQETDYLINKKNGLLIQKISDFSVGLDYFLNHLSNWNTSLVESVSIIEAFGPNSTIEKWRELLGVQEN